MVGRKTLLAKHGTTLFAPRGVAHTYRYLGQTPGKHRANSCVPSLRQALKDSSRRSAQ